MSMKIKSGSRKRFGSKSVRLHNIFRRGDKSYFWTFELMHSENVKRKMMKTENRQVCCEEKCWGCNPTYAEGGCIYVMRYV